MKVGKYTVQQPRVGDQIVYVCKSVAGGVDGKDNTDKGGHALFATFNKDEAIAYYPNQVSIEPIVVDVEAAIRTALQKLDVIDKLALGFLPEGRVTR